MSKFKVGDRVQICKDLKEGMYDGCKFQPEMLKYRGTVATITKLICENRYYIDSNGWVWTEEMLLPAVTSTLTIPYTGNKAEAHKQLEAEISKLGVVVEVKRTAKIGEWIKIVSKGCHGPGLIVGDIHKVTFVHRNGGVETNKNNVFNNFEHNEYVVLENYIPSKTKGAKATPERIEKAKAFAKELLAECFDREISVVFYVSKSNKTVEANLSYGLPYALEHATAKCAPEDECNVWIGRAVALCKAVGRELPDWLIGKTE